MSDTNTVDLSTKITKKHLVKDIADFIHMSQNDVDRVIDAFIHIVSDHLHQRHDVRLTGFGIFSTRDRKACIARNPATGKEIQVQASVVPTFRPGTPLREKINPGKVSADSAESKKVTDAVSSEKKKASKGVVG